MSFWIEFLAPGFSTGPVPAVVGTWEVKQEMGLSYSQINKNPHILKTSVTESYSMTQESNVKFTLKSPSIKMLRKSSL